MFRVLMCRLAPKCEGAGMAAMGIVRVATAALVLSASATASNEIISQSKADYGSMDECRLQTRAVASGIKMFAPSFGMTELKTFEFEQPALQRFVVQTRYLEQGHSFVAETMCDSDGKAQTTIILIE